jgi:hypothetical protein
MYNGTEPVNDLHDSLGSAMLERQESMLFRQEATRCGYTMSMLDTQDSCSHFGKCNVIILENKTDRTHSSSDLESSFGIHISSSYKARSLAAYGSNRIWGD